MTYEHGEPGEVLTLMEEEDERRREERSQKALQSEYAAEIGCQESSEPTE